MKTTGQFAVVYVIAPRATTSRRVHHALDSTWELVSKYNVKRVPRLFVVKNGTIEYAQDYYYEGYEKSLREAIEEATAEDPQKGNRTALSDGKK